MTKDWTFGRFFLPKAKPSGRCAPAGRGSAGNAKTLEFQRFSTIRPPDFPAVPHDFPTVHPARAPPRAPSKDDIHVTNVQTDPKDHSSRLPVPWTRAMDGVGRGWAGKSCFMAKNPRHQPPSGPRTATPARKSCFMAKNHRHQPPFRPRTATPARKPCFMAKNPHHQPPSAKNERGGGLLLLI